MRLPPLSLEALIGLFTGLFVGLVEMNWELRSLGVLFTAGLAIHIAKRLDARLSFKVLGAVIAIGLLLIGTYRPIWTSFHEDFPQIAAETVLSRIVIFCTLAACVVAAYFFWIRPRGKEGYRVLPAQLIAFGVCVIAAGFIPVAIGLGWQFKQNWAAGIAPSGAPRFTVGPPLIAPPESRPALPPPSEKPSETQYFSNYSLTEQGVAALASELYKSRDVLKRRVELDRMNTDATSSSFVSQFARACDQAGVECPVGNVHPNSPDEKGLLIYVGSPAKPPAIAEELRALLGRLGINVPFVERAGLGDEAFVFFVGPRPN